MKALHLSFFLVLGIISELTLRCSCCSYLVDNLSFGALLYDVWGCANASLLGTFLSSGQYFPCGQVLANGQPTPACLQSGSGWECAQDFERALGDDRYISMVQLNTNNVPALNSSSAHHTIINATQFAYWFQRNDQFNFPFTFSFNVTNDWTVTGYCDSTVYGISTASFFPLDNLGFGSQYNLSGTPRNFGFTFQVHLRFTYNGNEFLSLTATHDVFLFINGLLAVDLGGVHAAEVANINLTAGNCSGPQPDLPCAWSAGSTPGDCACMLRLTIGHSYTFDLFTTQRHTAVSDLFLATNLALQCPVSDICGVCMGNNQSCASGNSTSTSIPTTGSAGTTGTTGTTASTGTTGTTGTTADLTSGTTGTTATAGTTGTTATTGSTGTNTGTTANSATATTTTTAAGGTTAGPNGTSSTSTSTSTPTSTSSTSSSSSSFSTGSNGTLTAPGTNNNHAGSGTNSGVNDIVIGVAAGIPVAALLLLVTIFLLFRRRKRRGAKVKPPTEPDTPNLYTPIVPEHPIDAEAPLPPKSSEESPARPSRKEEQIPLQVLNSADRQGSPLELLEGIEIGRKLGAGSFGTVYLGLWHHTTNVALKCLSGPEMEDEFVKELNALRSFVHPNIVKYLGLFVSLAGERYIVSEFVPDGDALQWVQRHTAVLTNKTLLEIAQQIACGMTVVENKNFVHRDLALRNILIESHGGIDTPTVKIADFGLARKLYYDQTYNLSNKLLPVRWSAPEVLEYQTYTQKSDLYAFGVTVWELMSRGATPWTVMSNAEVVQAITQGEMLPQPPECSASVYNVILNCCAFMPHDRPKFVHVYERLEAILKAQEF